MRAPNHLNALRAFESSARHLSYVRAAEELNVTPAAIGQLVRPLEETLGVALFHRSQAGPARLELTDAAREALGDLQEGFDRLSMAVAKLKAHRSHVTISVTVPPAFAEKRLLRRIDRFQARCPTYDLRLDTNGRLVDFTTDRVDVGIRYGAGHWPGLIATRLLSDDFFPVCSPSIISVERPLASATDLRHHALIHDMSMRDNRVFPTWRTWLRQAGCIDVDAERGLQVNDSAASFNAAIAGSGVALGRSVLVVDDLASGRLVRPFGKAQASEFAYYVVHRDETAIAPAVAAFKEWLLDEAAMTSLELTR
jgi:LysR family transcriptional regulator, glycine cleavage system transcriptional activator